MENNQICGYIPLGYNMLQSSLHQQRTHVERLLKPIKSTWSKKRVTSISDGWSNLQRPPVSLMTVMECRLFSKLRNVKEWGKKVDFLSGMR